MDLIKKYLEEETKDTGWKPAQSSRKDKYGNPIKTANVARSLARQAMQTAMKDLKKGPEAGKRQVEEVELDEASSAERKERKEAINNVHKGFYDKVSKSKLKKVSKIGSDTYFVKSRSIYDPHESHFKTASGKYGSSMHSSEGGVPSHEEIHKDIKDHNPHLSKDEIKSAADVVHAHINKHRLGEEVEQIDETPKVDRGLSDDDKVEVRTTRAKGYTTGRAVNMGNTSGGSFRGSGPSPYKNLNVSKSGERKGMVTKSAIQSTKNQIKSRLNKEEVEELDEISQKLATAAYAKRTGTMSHNDPVARKKEDKAWERIGKRWGKKGQEKADAAADKYQAEEVEDRILDKGHSPERLQKTIDKAREHEKSYFKKRADSFFKPTDYESRSKEDSRLKRVRKVISAASAAKQYATDTAPKPFTGRIGRKQ